MKAVVLTGISKIELQDVPEPKLQQDGDVLLKIEKVGVCGSDVHYYETGRIGSQVVQYPFIVGHECSATVKEIGKAVTGSKVGDQVVVEIADTGPGIPEIETPHVWEELYRGEGARGVHGSGLGLSLVRAIVARHEGEISLRSRAGQGTVVTMRLPVGGVTKR